MDLSILIVNYQTDRLLAECCHSLPAGCQGLDWEAVVVDNASTDGSADFLGGADPSRFRLIRSEENLGFARGNNRALAEARGRLVLLLNPDTWVFPGSLTRLARHLESDPAPGAVCPRTWLDRERSLEVCSLKLPGPALALASFTSWGRLNPRSQALQRAWEIDRRLAAARSGPVEVEGIGGACLMARRDLLEDLDGLDERFYMGYEDTDLSRRIRDRGLRLEILVEAEIVHYFGHSKRKRGARDAHLYRWDRGPLLYLRKHHHPVWSLLLRMLKLPERFSRARPSLDREAPSDSSARELGWHGSEPPYLVELSNSPRFLDSFLAATDDSRMTIPAALTARLAPGTYHWRTRPLARPWDGTHLGCGSFVRR